MFLRKLKCLQVFNIMVILGFMINYMLRVNISIAIIAMVIPRNSSNNLTHTIPVNNTQINISTSTESVGTSQVINYEETNERGTRYEWNEYEVNIILGAFFWGYILTEIPGGRLAEIFGGKRVFGYSTLGTGIATLFIPLAATFGYQFVAAVRLIVGFVMGPTWPAILPMSSHWIPPTERSKFASNMLASTLGVAFTMSICGFLIASLGWESVFYFTGAVTCIYSVIWFYVVYESPAKHPRISDEEKRVIEEAIGNLASKKSMPVPWKSVAMSMPVWAITVANFCNIYSYFTIITQLPTYMKYILNYDIQKNGLLTALPYVGKYFFALFSATIADYVCRNRKLSITTTRKLFNTISFILPGICMIILAQYGQNRLVAVTTFTLSLTLNGALSAGYLPNIVDIAPNFSGTLCGLILTLSSFTGYFSSLMVGTLTLNNQTYEQWRIIFWILAGFYLLGALFYLIFGTAKVQQWNDPHNESVYRKNELIGRRPQIEVSNECEVTM